MKGREEKRIFYPMENGSLFRSIRASCCHAKFSTHIRLCSHRQARKVEIKIQPQNMIIRFLAFQQKKNEKPKINKLFIWYRFYFLLLSNDSMWTFDSHLTHKCMFLSRSLFLLNLPLIFSTRFRFSTSLSISLSRFFFKYFLWAHKMSNTNEEEKILIGIIIWSNRILRFDDWTQTKPEPSPTNQNEEEMNKKKAILKQQLGSSFHMNFSNQPFRFVSPLNKK